MKIYTTSLCLLLLGVSSLVHGQAPASLSWGGSDSPSLRALSSLAEFTGNALSGDVLGSVESGADLIAASANVLSSEPAQRSGLFSRVTRQTTRISNRISRLRSAAGNDDYLTARQIVSLYLVAYPNDLLYQYFVEGGGEVLIKPLSWGATYWSYHWSYEIQFDNSWIDNEWNRQEAVRHLRNHLEAMADENGSAINKHLTTWDGDIEVFLDRIAAAGVPLGVVFSPKQMTASQLEGLNEAIVETYRLVPYLGGFVLTFELASGQTLSFTVYGQRELTTGEKWLIIGTPAAGFAAGVLVKVGGKWVFRQITKRVDDFADLAPKVADQVAGELYDGIRLTNKEMRHLTNLGHKRGLGVEWKKWHIDGYGEFDARFAVPKATFAPGATRYVVMHEMMHIWELRRLVRELGPVAGKAKYLENYGDASRTILREQFVLDAIRKRSRLWDSLSDLEKRHAREYLDGLGGESW